MANLITGRHLAIVARQAKPPPWKMHTHDMNIPKLDRVLGPPSYTTDQNWSSGSQNHSYETKAAQPEHIYSYNGEIGRTKLWC